MANRYRNYDLEAVKQDSSPKARKDVTLKTGPILVVEEGKCLDGCGSTVTKLFAMGHDARYKGILMRAYVAGLPVTTRTNGKDKLNTPLALAAVGNGWVSKLKATRDRELAKAAAAPARKAKGGPEVGDKVKIKIGRWTKDATVTGVFANGVHYEYTDAKGNRKTHKVAA
jgi:hypothetical protein